MYHCQRREVAKLCWCCWKFSPKDVRHPAHCRKERPREAIRLVSAHKALSASTLRPPEFSSKSQNTEALPNSDHW